MVDKVTDLSKIVTDPVLLNTLAMQGIDKDYVEFSQDYAAPATVNGKLEKGKSPFAKFYRDLKSNKRFMVVSGLPMVDADGVKIEAAWTGDTGKWASKNNLFEAKIADTQVTLKVKNDQPDGRKAGDQVSFQPQLFLNGAEITCLTDPILLKVDPDNENYSENVLEWDFGICKRRLRIVQGQLLGTWVFVQDPRGSVRLKYNQSGDYRLKLGQFRVSDDEEIVPLKAFENPRFGYPLTINDSDTYYSAASDCFIYSQSTTYSTARNAATGTLITDSTYLEAANYLSGVTFDVSHMYFAFDTSPLPDNASISEVTLSVYGPSEGYQAEQNDGYSDLKLFQGTQADTPVADDFNNFGTTLLSDNLSAWEYPLLTNAYNTISLNAAGIALINKTGLTKYCCRSSGDVNNWSPSHVNACYIYSNEKGAGYKPKLVVTYTPPSNITITLAATANASSAETTPVSIIQAVLATLMSGIGAEVTPTLVLISNPTIILSTVMAGSGAEITPTLLISYLCTLLSTMDATGVLVAPSLNLISNPTVTLITTADAIGDFTSPTISLPLLLQLLNTMLASGDFSSPALQTFRIIPDKYKEKHHKTHRWI